MLSWEQINQRWDLPPAPPANRPVFLLACIWRTGSTLLQRLLCSSGELLLWGEPYADARIIQSLCQSASALRQRAWPHTEFFPDSLDDLENRWIANMYPPVADLRDGYRALLDRTLAEPAEREAFFRFGLKSVRLNTEHGRFLKWLYPDARFVLLVRDPWAAWKSYKGFRWVYQWPAPAIVTPEQFGTLWTQKVNDFLQWHDDAVMLIRYEDVLADRAALYRLQEHCELIAVRRNALSQRIAGRRPRKAHRPATPWELQVITTICGETAARLGYMPPLTR